MKKIIVSIATTLIASLALVACNSDITNASDVSSGGAASLAKAVCTSSNNWQSVGLGMTASQVQARLGAPASIVAVPPNTEYHYERCRAGLFHKADATETKAEDDVNIYFGGVVQISGNRGVLSVVSPILDSDLPMHCEWDLYNYPFNYEGGVGPSRCRTSNNPF
jgi:hypothetical protein